MTKLEAVCALTEIEAYTNLLRVSILLDRPDVLSRLLQLRKQVNVLSELVVSADETHYFLAK
jgi:hypothetical protein